MFNTYIYTKTKTQQKHPPKKPTTLNPFRKKQLIMNILTSSSHCHVPRPPCLRIIEMPLQTLFILREPCSVVRLQGPLKCAYPAPPSHRILIFAGGTRRNLVVKKLLVLNNLSLLPSDKHLASRITCKALIPLQPILKGSVPQCNLPRFPYLRS